MNARSMLLLVGLTLSLSLASAQDYLAQGRAAEDMGKVREALNHYVNALDTAPDGSSKDQELREKIISLANQMKPAPAIPDEASRSLVRGRTAFKLAQDREAFGRAAEEFRQAAKKAPWLAEAYFNQGVALDKAERYPEAVRALKLYLLVNPNAGDTAKVKEMIYELEYKQEEAGRKARSAVADAAKAKEEKLGKLIQALAGRWFVQGSSDEMCGTTRSYYRLVPTGGNALSLEYTGTEFIQRGKYACSTMHSKESFQLEIGENYSVNGVGRQVNDYSSMGMPQCRFSKTFEITGINGVVSSDGASITITYQLPSSTGICSFGPGFQSVTLNLRRDR